MDNNKIQESYYLNSPEKCLLLAPEDWHVMDEFTGFSILLVLANTVYEKDDYIFEPCERTVETKI